MQSWCIDDDSLLNRGFFGYFMSLYQFFYSFLIATVPGKSSLANNFSNSGRVTLFDPSIFPISSLRILSGTYNDLYDSSSSSSGLYIVKKTL